MWCNAWVAYYVVPRLYSFVAMMAQKTPRVSDGARSLSEAFGLSLLAPPPILARVSGGNAVLARVSDEVAVASIVLATHRRLPSSQSSVW